MGSLLLPGAEAASRAVQLLEKSTAEGRIFEVRNGLNMPVNATLSLSHGKLPLTVIQKSIPANTTLRLFSLRKGSNPQLALQHNFSYSAEGLPAREARLAGGRPAAAGSPPAPVLAVAGKGAIYDLPWKGGPFHISQGAGGDFSHDTPKGRYAVDVAMPPGTPVVAARGGTVLKAEDGQEGRYPRAAGNYVRIRHEDGSHTAYLHLSRGSLKVREGQRVEGGELLGHSGNTGRSTGPHLHFVVQKEISGSLLSVPFRFSQTVSQLPNFARR